MRSNSLFCAVVAIYITNGRVGVFFCIVSYETAIGVSTKGRAFIFKCVKYGSYITATVTYFVTVVIVTVRNVVS